MKTLILTAKYIFFSSILISQNLVPNNSFEVLGSFGNIAEWEYNNLEQVAFFRDGHTTSSQDFLGEVDPWSGNYNVITISLGVPDNYFGYESPHHGLRYAGFWSQRIKGGTGTISTNRTGKLFVELSSPLIKDMTYIIRYSVSKMDHSNKTPKYEVYLSTDASGGNKKSLYKGNVHNKDDWHKYIHEFKPDINGYKYLIFEGDNWHSSEYFAGIYLDNLLVVDKCSYDGWNCYCGHGAIIPYFTTVVDNNSCFKVFNLDNVLEAEIKIYDAVPHLLWSYSVCSDNCITDPIMWADFGVAAGQYEAQIKLSNHCDVWEQSVTFQKWSNANSYCHNEYQPPGNYICVGNYTPIPDCEPYIFKYGENILLNGQQNFCATETIIAGNTVQIESGSIVEFRAGEKIILTPGFIVESGATFNAIIADCSDFIPDKNMQAGNIISNYPASDEFIDLFIIHNDDYFNELNNLAIYPNPFTNSLTISIAQPEQTDANIYLTDAYGRQVLGIFNGSIDKGQHSIDVSTEGITKGLYFCIMETPSGRNVVKVVKLE